MPACGFTPTRRGCGRGLLPDFFFSLYQMICFPVYGIPKARRGEYLVFDRGADSRYPRFFEYGDAESYRKGLERLQKEYGESGKAD